MRVRIDRRPALLALVGIAGLIAGCSGSGTKPIAQIRTLNASTNGGFVTAMVNGSATFGQQTLTASPPAYLFINPGTSQFSYTTFADSGQSTNNLPIGVNPYSTSANLSAGTNYTAYVIGRPDLVTAVTTLPFPYGSMQDVVYADTHSTPSGGSVNVRFLNAAPDANGANGVDIKIDGTTAATNVAFGAITSFQTTTSASHVINVVKTGTPTSVVSQTLTFQSQKTETIIIQEPTATPIPSPTSFTFQLQQIEEK